MIDILLINPPTIRTYKRMAAEAVSMPPIGLMYIGAYCKNAGYEAELIDLTVDYYSLEKFITFLKEKNPKIIGMSSFTECFTPVKILCRKIKEVLPETTIVIGGPGATFSHEQYFEETLIDYVVKGEGEYKFIKLIENILFNKGSLSDIKGILYRNNNEIVQNMEDERIQKLDNLIWPDRDLIKMDKYLYPFTISTSRGCPGNCIFCSSRQYWGKKIQLRSAESIFQEILHLYDKYRMKQFFFVDDTFTMIPDRAKKVANMLIEKKLSLTWGCESRADVVSHDLLSTLHEAGCRKIQFGLESANNDILKKIGKKVTREQVLNAVQVASSLGFDINVSFIIGHPFDTQETIKETLDFALSLFHEYKVNPYCAINTPYPGTVVFEKPEEFGLEILTDNFDNYTMDNPIIQTENFTTNDLRKYYHSFQDTCLGKEEKLFYH